MPHRRWVDGNAVAAKADKKSKAPSPQGVSKFEYAAVLAASLAYMMANQQDLVGLTVFDTDIRLDIPQGNGASHLDQIFKQLEKVAPGKKTDVAETLHHLANKVPRRGLVILISDLLDDPDKILLALQHLKHARHQDDQKAGAGPVGDGACRQSAGDFSGHGGRFAAAD